MKKLTLITAIVIFCITSLSAQQATRVTQDFNQNWKFKLDSVNDYSQLTATVISWRSLKLPHDWSIEMPFEEKSPTGTGGGALRGGTGWYSKSFTLPSTDQGKKITIHFDGVYCRSSVWVNGHLLGYRPNGYISFEYDLTPYLNFKTANLLVVKVDNQEQPNSRWYSGSGIYRKVWLQKTNATAAISNWGTFVSTPVVSERSATLNIQTTLGGKKPSQVTGIRYQVYDVKGKLVSKREELLINSGIHSQRKAEEPAATRASQDQQVAPISYAATMSINQPQLWNIETPHLYKLVTQLLIGKNVVDETATTFGVRSFTFDVNKGFILNGKRMKIRGVCNHHDLGSLGAAFNYRAAERQLEILKRMGCNGIRTAHNPPAPELLDLCDKMGFIVMAEAFDMWEKSKNKADYHRDFVKWHKRDLEDQVLRDRNHPSVFTWSVGNEVGEQWGDSTDQSGKRILADLVGIVKNLDSTRPTVTANNEVNPWSKLFTANLTDINGYNYNHQLWDSVLIRWGRKPFIVTESVSALQTRGHYDMPSDSIRIWPTRWDLPLLTGNPDFTCSAYENCYAPWGSSHEQSLIESEKYDHVSGMYVWTGFDYLGEPTPYPWPARSSYFGIIDLAGFPKDAYYLYQSVWTTKPVLHLFPHWNWQPGKVVDVWAYYNNADEVELFLNGQSMGVRQKQGDELHVFWRVNYIPGTLTAVSRKNGQVVLTKKISTAGKPAKIKLTADRSKIKRGGDDLSFITATIVDENGVMVPAADNLVKFTTADGGTVVATDNGSQTSLESFQQPQRKAFNGLCLAIVKGGDKAGNITVTATAEGLGSTKINLVVK